RHLIERVPVSDVCDQYKIQPSMLYNWQKQFFENGAAAFEQTRSAPAKTGIAEDWLILAMAQHRLGQHDDARRSFERATALDKAQPAEGPRSPHWSRRLSYDLLRAEAAELLGPGRP